MGKVPDLADLVELRLRVEASELRHAAIESRQARIEKMLVEQSGELRASNKLLNVLTDGMQGLQTQMKVLSGLVNELVSGRPSPPKRR